MNIFDDLMNALRVLEYIVAFGFIVSIIAYMLASGFTRAYLWTTFALGFLPIALALALYLIGFRTNPTQFYAPLFGGALMLLWIPIGVGWLIGCIAILCWRVFKNRVIANVRD